VGETRVDLLHLLEDLRDAYPGSLEETILTEIVANALDSGATRVQVLLDSRGATVTVVDDGRGMKRRELARYHDIATSSKTRGEGIGFAGVGIKLGLLLSEEVLTETRRGKGHVATSWHLASRHRAPWHWVPPPGVVRERGTSVRLKLQNALSPLLDRGFVCAALRRHFAPFFDPTFDEILGDSYPAGVRFEVDGDPLPRARREGPEVAPLAVRFPRKRKPQAFGFLARDAADLAEEHRGVAVSTRGKVIKGGWDWLGISPVQPQRIGGVLEVPALAACLTLNKADFIRTGARGATYLAYRKAIQEAVGHQLGMWGDAQAAGGSARRRAARPLERDLGRVLVDLADEFPLLTTLVEWSAGGQRRIPTGRAAAVEEGRELVAVSLLSDAGEEAPTAERAPAGESPQAGAPPAKPAGAAPREPPEKAGAEGERLTTLPGTPGRQRAARTGISIDFENRPGELELGRLVESTVWVNEAHPAYQRALASRAEGYHVALTVALALAPLAVEPARERSFVNAFLSLWGEALEERAAKRRAR
jgi:hypothetical protein